MHTLTIDFTSATGKIKPMHALNNAPMHWANFSLFHYLSEAGIPVSRLHDTGGAFGGGIYVDVANLFPSFDADPEDPASYDFLFNDALLCALSEAGAKPFYRLGCTIENYCTTIGPRRIFPPKDAHKWAVICEHIIRHCNEGWADGHHLGIEYWEIWNEPDNDGVNLKNNQMWKGSMQDFFELYEVASKRLKAHFGDSIKVGGFASCGFYAINRENPSPSEVYYVDFAEKFLDFCVKTESPLDFFSWHSYASVAETEKMADFVDEMLTKRGLENIETQLNEWNNAPRVELRGTPEAAAKAAAMMLAFQNKKTTTLCYYDARIGQSVYGGMFNPMNYKPLGTYYSFKAFGELYALGTQTEVAGGDGIYAIAAADESGEKRALMLTNLGEDVELETGLAGFKAVRVDGENGLVPAELDAAKLVLAKHEVVLLTNY